MNIDLQHKKILVTGASRGIGRAIALQLAASGATVAAHFREDDKAAMALKKHHPDSIHLYQADFTESAAVLNLYEEVLRDLSGLNVLVNNAGLASYSSLEATDNLWLDHWERTMQVNLTATALLCKKAIADFTSQGEGTIINISSRAAFRGDTKDYLAYAASKGGLVSLTRSIARAFGKQGIIAFNVAPGFVKTDMAQDFIDQYGENLVTNDIALKKLTQPQDLAPLVCFLASGMANHATGATIDVNAASYVH